MNRNIALLFILVFSCFLTKAQSPANKPKKYPSLLWEISGKGLAKPSYLFGTMHVSSKLAFHLSDSFYLGIRNADIVALETNPETWQRDLLKYDYLEAVQRDMNTGSGYQLMPNDFLRKSTFQVTRYERLIELALSSKPMLINNLLYRSNSDESSDFEEDTYLDLHIFQTGKRWGKRICSVENFDESMRLTTEAYFDGMRDEKKKANYDYNPEYSYDKLETAYRTGNLDLLDTITKVNQQSVAFNEKFLYRRNEIQATSIDSILKTKATLFVGVGASHLPGQRGVIELLRRMGYKLRPIKMGERNSRFKDEVDKVRVTVPIKRQIADDGFFKVDMPGELFSNDAPLGIKQYQYADMANGSYYMITRIPTNASLWGASSADVTRQVDSLLYENIPGKIIIKKGIIRNGYPGFDIINKTRRGDMQRYAIFITPFEVLIFKVSGSGEYVKVATEANRFFNTIVLKEYVPGWKSFMPEYGGFEAVLPHEPFTYKDDKGITHYRAFDKKSGNNFQIQHTVIHNYDFIEEDSFDLNLVEESFSTSEFIGEIVSSKHTVYLGYPSLEVKYKHKDGSWSLVKYLLKGPHYFAIIANGNNVDEQMQQFHASFAIRPFIYKDSQLQTDSSLSFTVSSPVPLYKTHAAIPSFDVKQLYRNAIKESDEISVDNGVYKEKLIQDEASGERIYIAFYKAPAYYYEIDSSKWSTLDLSSKHEGWIVRTEKRSEWPNGTKVTEYIISDTNSSRALWCKQFIKQGLWYWVATETDTAALQSTFLTQFFTTFRPIDTIQSINPFERKSVQFFADFFSVDSVRHKNAIANVSTMTFQDADLEQLKRVLTTLSWKEKQYLNIKKDFIWQLSTLSTKESTDYLKELYTAAGDTLELQHAIIESLLGQKTPYSYSVFKNIIINEPPVLEVRTSDYIDYEEPRYYNRKKNSYTINISSFNRIADGSFLNNLADSLQLTSEIFKDLLPLINLDDYKQPIMQLMQVLVDSNYLKASDYEVYYTKLMIEAKQALKKQFIAEKSKSIEWAQSNTEVNENKRRRGGGNSQLSLYSTLLMPFWDKQAVVASFIKQLLTTNDQQLKYTTLLLLVQNKRTIPDTLIEHFASLDEYRYDLYTDLKHWNQLELMPQHFKNIDQLAKSRLIVSNEYIHVDTSHILDKVAVEHLGHKGFIYVYQYKEDKDERSWKIATVGMIPADGKDVNMNIINADDDYEFTTFTDAKIEEDKPISAQVQKLVKQMLYAKRKSAAEFYEKDRNYENNMFRYRN
jgi:uncharacterized protein YbaP (TraB family)